MKCDCHNPPQQLEAHDDVHSQEAHEAITAELVACTLGQRSRLELRMDVWGTIARALRRFAEGARF